MNTLVHSIWTVVMMITVLGIYIWAYSPRRKADFKEASMLALETTESTPREEKTL